MVVVVGVGVWVWTVCVWMWLRVWVGVGAVPVWMMTLSACAHHDNTNCPQGTAGQAKCGVLWKACPPAPATRPPSPALLCFGLCPCDWGLRFVKALLPSHQAWQAKPSVGCC